MTDVEAPLTWTDLWADITQRLGSSEDARHIIERVSGRAGASWLITLTTTAPPTAAAQVDAMVRRRLEGEPLQYVLGRWGFRQLDLQVDRRVLIPRPETEQVVEAALQSMCTCQRPIVADLGTGSGAIALSIALEAPHTDVHATDVSADALDVARINANDVPAQVAERVQFHHGSWFDALPHELCGTLDMVISNPPYIAEHERAELDAEVVDWEPEGALFGGPDGTDALELLVRTAPEWLNQHGVLVVELAPSQASLAHDLAWKAGFFSVAIGVDLAGRQRWLVATKAAS